MKIGVGSEGQSFEGKNPIIEQNVRMLETLMMQVLLGEESMGGNAGFYEIHGKRYSCGAVHAYVDPQTGEFKGFYGRLPSAEEQKGIAETVECIIRVALDLSTGFTKIVEIKKHGILSSDAERVIDESIAGYNQKK